MDIEILNNTKMLIGISDNSSDELLSFYIEDTKAAILSYCRIEFIPKQLWGLISQIAADLYRHRDNNDVLSITEGDRKIDFSHSQKSVVDNYRSRLRPFVNTLARVPSEILREAQDENI